MIKYILAILILLITSCSSKTPEVKVIDTEVESSRPAPPEPVSVYDIKWSVIDGSVCLTPSGGVKLNTQSKEVVQYIKEMQKLVCYYEDSYGFCKK